MPNDLRLERTPIPGLLVVRLPLHTDSRGWFKENWQREKMVALGLPDFGPVQRLGLPHARCRLCASPLPVGAHLGGGGRLLPRQRAARPAVGGLRAQHAAGVRRCRGASRQRVDEMGSSRPPGPGQPRVCGNDWRVLKVPSLGAWQPTLPVSVVIPAHNPVHLTKVLAGLAAQSYPMELLEVIVVVDDGSDRPLPLPEVRPANTRFVRLTDAWGRAGACLLGADHSDGEVVHWFDADMVPAREEIEAQLRWHHLVDYAVVLGDKLFADQCALDHVSPQRLRDNLADGIQLEQLVRGDAVSHAWIDEILDLTNGGLASAGPRAMRVHAGASASVGRDLLRASGGMPTDLVLGEDIVLGYRLREAGAVFIPDREARCVHLGPSSVMRSGPDVNRYNKPFITDKVPEFRGHRIAYLGSYEVLYVEVVIAVDGTRYETVRAAADALLASSVPDLVVTIVAGWPPLSEGRRAVLADERLDLRLAAYDFEPRVRLVHSLADPCEATFRLGLPGPGAFPVGRSLANLLFEMENDHVGTVLVDLGGGSHARLERTSAVRRACRVVTPGERLVEVLISVHGVRRVSADEAGFVCAEASPKVRHVQGLVPWGGGEGSTA